MIWKSLEYHQKSFVACSGAFTNFEGQLATTKNVLLIVSFKSRLIMTATYKDSLIVNTSFAKKKTGRLCRRIKNR